MTDFGEERAVPRAKPAVGVLRTIRGGAEPMAPFVRGDHAELADRVLDALDADRRNVVAAEGGLWHFAPERGLWRQLARPELQRIVKSFAGAQKGRDGALKISAAAADGAITLAHAEVSHEGFFDAAPSGVAFTNGFAAVEGGAVVLRPHDRAHRARAGHGFAYDPQADRAPLLAFLGEVFGDAEPDEREARIAFLQEHVGACLVGLAPAYQRCAVLLGAGDNAKSTTERVCYEGALPDGTTVSLAPQQWGERFQGARLIGALANVVDEMPEAELIKTGAFKAIVAGEAVHMEHKNRDPFEARIRCGHVFSANALPGSSDLTDGFYRRFVILYFTRKFTGTATHRPEHHKAIVAACRPGIAAWALEGAARLVRQGGYTIPATSAAAVAEWRRDCDNVALFVSEATSPASYPDPGTRATQLYASYRAWAERTGHRAVSSRKFAQRMEASGAAGTHRNDGAYYPVSVRVQP